MPENYTSLWLSYECGVLVGRLDKNVCPFVLDTDLNVLKASPLSRQQAKSALDKASVLRLVNDINTALGDKAVRPEAVETSFEAFWPKLDFADLPASVQETRESDDKIDEILSLVQMINLNTGRTRIEFLDRDLLPHLFANRLYPVTHADEDPQDFDEDDQEPWARTDPEYRMRIVRSQS